MRIAIASRGLEIAPRYEFAEDLTCYNVDRGVITGCQNIPFPRMSVTEMIETFDSLDVKVFITGTINYEMAKKFCSSGIEVVAGAQGPSREVVESYINKTLSGTDELCGDANECRA